MRKKFDWTEDKVRYLKEHYPTGSCSDIADVLRCSISTVQKYAIQIGLKKAEGFRPQNFYGRYTRNRNQQIWK